LYGKVVQASWGRPKIVMHFSLFKLGTAKGTKLSHKKIEKWNRPGSRGHTKRHRARRGKGKNKAQKSRGRKKPLTAKWDQKKAAIEPLQQRHLSPEQEKAAPDT